MTREELIENYCLEDDVIILEPWEEFCGGIIGVTDDRCHIVYGYKKLIDSLATEYEKEWNEKEHLADEERPDFEMDAVDWIDYNTVRALPYMNADYRPILVMECD